MNRRCSARLPRSVWCSWLQPKQSGVNLATAEANGWDLYHQLLRSGEVPARLCTDAYLAAVAMANGWRLVSFDRDFERFEGLAWLALPGA